MIHRCATRVAGPNLKQDSEYQANDTVTWVCWMRPHPFSGEGNAYSTWVWRTCDGVPYFQLWFHWQIHSSLRQSSQLISSCCLAPIRVLSCLWAWRVFLCVFIASLKETVHTNENPVVIYSPSCHCFCVPQERESLKHHEGEYMMRESMPFKLYGQIFDLSTLNLEIHNLW